MSRCPRCLSLGCMLLATLCGAGCARFKEMVMPRGGKALYVATDGSDEHTGTRARPFRTLERARDAIRTLKKADGLPTGGVTVILRGGVYERGSTFALTKQDSGTAEAPIVYRAARGEEVRLVGGKVVATWQPVADGATRDRIPAPARAHVLQADLRALGIADFGQVKGGGLELFFNDQPMPVARGPNDGEIRIDDLRGGDQIKHPRDGTTIDRIGKFTYKGDRPRRWVGEKNLWLHGYWYRDWAEDRQKVAKLDADKRLIELAPPYHHYGYRKGQWFHSLNALSELDLLGEWVIDPEAGTLYFWPPSPIERGRGAVSVLATLVSVKHASHVRLEGLVLEVARGTAVTVSGGTGVLVAGCTLRNLGGWAARIAGGTAHGVASCDISGTGGGGISLSGGDRKSLTPSGHHALNNHIHHFSRVKRMCQPAVSLAGVGNRVAHNLIHDAPHQAMSFGGNDHLIELNEIHHVCHEANDGGAIYAGYDWTTRGTVIRHNFMHHVTGLKGRGCVGVYLDDMSSGTTIAANVFYKVTRAAFIGGGRDCTVENNLFVECTRAMHMDARAMGWAKHAVNGKLKERLEAMPYKSALWRSRYPRLVHTWHDEPAAPKGNLIARNVFYQCKPWDDITKVARPYATVEQNLVDEDPLFVDAETLNFQLQHDSPAYKLGFQRIPFEKIGLYRDKFRRSLPPRGKRTEEE